MTIPMPIYLNACGHGLPDPSCASAISQQALSLPGDPDNEAELRRRARQACAGLLGIEPACLGLGAGTFQLWASVMERLTTRRGRVLVAAHEWRDNVRWLQRMAARGNITLEVVPAEGGEVFDPAAWSARIDEDVRALCLPHVTSVEGLCYPVREIAALPRPEDALMVVDAAQALGRVPVQPGELGCDVLVGTARKWLRGPRQTAMVWLSARAERVLDCEARSVELFDLNAALLAGLERAAKLVAERTIPAIRAEIERLDDQLRTGLSDLPGIETGAGASVGTISCAVASEARQALDARLRTGGILGKWCDASRDEPLSGADPTAARLRLSPHVYNTERDIAAAIQAIRPG